MSYQQEPTVFYGVLETMSLAVLLTKDLKMLLPGIDIN